MLNFSPESWNPERRMKPDEAHRHRWLAGNRQDTKRGGRKSSHPSIIKDNKDNIAGDDQKLKEKVKEKEKDKKNSAKKVTNSATIPRVYKACKNNRLRECSRKEYIPNSSLSKTSSEESLLLKHTECTEDPVPRLYEHKDPLEDSGTFLPPIL